MLELTEVRELLDGRRGSKDIPVTEEALQNAIQALLFHQCLYEDTHGAREIYRLIVAQDRFFERYFGAMGYRLIFDARARMVALEVGNVSYGWRQNRLKKDETIVLFALRVALEEGLKEGAIDETGRVQITTDDLVDRIRLLAGAEPPLEARLVDILKMLRRKGAVRIGDRDRIDKVTPITILSGIRILVPDVFVEGVILWLDQRAAQAERVPEDVVAFVSAHIAGQTTGDGAENDADGETDDATEH